MNNYSNPVTVTGNPASFEASGNGKLLSLSVPFSPIQDLHGYANPWPAGGGKQLLNPSMFEVSQSAVNGVTGSVNADGTITLHGTATANTIFDFVPYTALSDYGLEPDISYTLSGYISNSVYVMFGVYGSGTDYRASTDAGKVMTFTESQIASLRYRLTIYIANGTNVDGVVVKPMICKTASADPAVFAPYSNICPITGRTGLSVYVSPTTSQADATTYAVDWTTPAGTVYGGTDEVVGGVLTDEWAEIPSYNGETITEPWLSSMDEYAPGATPTTGAQVVYKLATPLTYQLALTQVELLIGQNYVWSDSNEAVTLTYVIEPFTKYTFIVNGNDYTWLVERDSYRTAVTPVYGETIQTLDGVGHTALLRVKGSLTVKLNPQTAAQTAAICADLLNAPCEVQYKCLQRNVNVTALMVLDVVSAMFLSRCLYLGQKWNDVDEIVLKEL